MGTWRKESARAVNGDPYEGQPVTDAETNVEATYAASNAPWLTLVGDLQYVANPNTDLSIPDALVGGVRVILTPTP